MNEKEIQSLTAQELIIEVYHWLNQKSNTAITFATILSDESNYGFVNDKQKEFIIRLRREVEDVGKFVDLMRIWLSANKDDNL